MFSSSIQPSNELNHRSVENHYSRSGNERSGATTLPTCVPWFWADRGERRISTIRGSASCIRPSGYSSLYTTDITRPQSPIAPEDKLRENEVLNETTYRAPSTAQASAQSRSARLSSVQLFVHPRKCIKDFSPPLSVSCFSEISRLSVIGTHGFSRRCAPIRETGVIKTDWRNYTTRFLGKVLFFYKGMISACAPMIFR